MNEIENDLLTNRDRLYHLGMEAVSKSTLIEAMNWRNPEIFKALFEGILDWSLKCDSQTQVPLSQSVVCHHRTTVDQGLNLCEFFDESTEKTY